MINLRTSLAGLLVCGLFAVPAFASGNNPDGDLPGGPSGDDGPVGHTDVPDLPPPSGRPRLDPFSAAFPKAHEGGQFANAGGLELLVDDFTFGVAIDVLATLPDPTVFDLLTNRSAGNGTGAEGLGVIVPGGDGGADTAPPPTTVSAIPAPGGVVLLTLSAAAVAGRRRR